MSEDNQNSILYPQYFLLQKMQAFIVQEQKKERTLIEKIRDLNDQIKSQKELELDQKILLLDSLGIDTKIQKLQDIKSKIEMQDPITQEEGSLFKKYLKIENLDKKQEINKKFDEYINNKYSEVKDFSERIENFINISEQNLNENPPEKIINQNGVCRGLSVLWSYGKILEDNQQRNSQEPNQALDNIKFMRDTSQTLINWDGKSVLDNDIKKNINDFIGNIRTYQDSIYDLVGINSSSNPNDYNYQDVLGKTSHTDSLLGTPQNLNSQGLGLFETREKNAQGDYEIKKINKTLDCRLLTDKSTLKNRLENIIKPNTMNILGISGEKGGHAVSVYKSKDGSLYFYDPNRGESTKTNLENITQYIQESSSQLFNRSILMDVRCEIYNMNESKPIVIDKEKFVQSNLDEFKNFIYTNKESNFPDKEKYLLNNYLYTNSDNVKNLIDSQDKGIEDFMKNNNILEGFTLQNIKDFSKRVGFKASLFYNQEISNIIKCGIKPKELMDNFNQNLCDFIVNNEFIKPLVTIKDQVIELLNPPNSVKLDTIKILSDLKTQNDHTVKEFIKDPVLVKKLETFLESKDSVIRTFNLDKKFLSGLIINESLKSPDLVKNFLEGKEEDIATLFNLLKNKQGSTIKKDSKSNNPEEIFNIFINSDKSSKAESIIKYNDIIDKIINKTKEISTKNLGKKLIITMDLDEINKITNLNDEGNIEKNANKLLDILFYASKHQGIGKIFGSHNTSTKTCKAIIPIISDNNSTNNILKNSISKILEEKGIKDKDFNSAINKYVKNRAKEKSLAKKLPKIPSTNETKKIPIQNIEKTLPSTNETKDLSNDFKKIVIDRDIIKTFQNYSQSNQFLIPKKKSEQKSQIIK